MPTPVWIWTGERPSFQPVRWKITVPLAPAIEYVVDKDVAQTRDDLTGTQSSRPGGLIIQQSFRSKVVAAGEQGKAIIQFLWDRENDNAAFYWYNPLVTAPPDATGVTTAGRHLVKLESWTPSHQSKVKQATINVTFKETLS